MHLIESLQLQLLELCALFIIILPVYLAKLPAVQPSVSFLRVMRKAVVNLTDDACDGSSVNPNRAGPFYFQ